MFKIKHKMQHSGGGQLGNVEILICDAHSSLLLCLPHKKNT